MSESTANQQDSYEQRYVLLLNPITAPADVRMPVAYANSIEKLKAFVEGEKVATYEDMLPNPLTGEQNWKFFKVHRKGGPLEGFNSAEESSYVGIPTLEQALVLEERKYTRWLGTLHHIE